MELEAELSPKISVIIPTFNHARSLPFCLASLFAQTYKNLEIIVVNDGSTDHTQVVLNNYASKIKIITQINQGANTARNNGFAASTGEYVIFCDADVVMKPVMLQKLLQLLKEHKEASYAYSGFKFGWKKFPGVIFEADRLRKLNFIHTTSLIRREDFPGFDPLIKRLQDWDVWLSMLSAGKVGVGTEECLFFVRVDGASRIGSSWLPKLVYQLPWSYFPWTPTSLIKYQQAREVILKKHKLI